MNESPNINIILNGQPHALASRMPLGELLAQLGFAGKPVVVELDEQAIFPRDYSRVEVQDGSRIELVTLAAGG
jgi:sulfur carrier protein